MNVTRLRALEKAQDRKCKALAVCGARLWRLAGLMILLTGSPHASGADASSSDIPLGDVPQFADEASARAACGADPVVWADRKSGFFYPKFHSDYGKTKHGTYTCYGRAKKADYWSLTPEGDGGREGREFPSMFCASCS